MKYCSLNFLPFGWSCIVNTVLYYEGCIVSISYLVLKFSYFYIIIIFNITNTKMFHFFGEML